MSGWFKGSQFANIAKTALTQAQKTIDKALDIQGENEPDNNNSATVSPEVTVDGTSAETESNSSFSGPLVPLWGSFTESFFVAQSANETLNTPLDKAEDNAITQGATDGPVIRQPKVDIDVQPNDDSNFFDTFLHDTSIEDPVLTRLDTSGPSTLFNIESSQETPSGWQTESLFIESQLLVNFDNDPPSGKSTNELKTSEVLVLDPELVKSDIIASSSVPPVFHVEESRMISSQESNDSIRTVTDEKLSSCEETLQENDEETKAEKSLDAGKESELTTCVHEEGVLKDLIPVESDVMVTSTNSSGSFVKWQLDDTSSFQCSNQGHKRMGSNGHRSLSDIETATSSDIEIISFASADMRCGAFNQFDLSRKRSRAETRENQTLHTRNSSEISSSDDGSLLDQENSSQKMRDLSELVEIRECKLLDQNREIVELKEANMLLKSQLQKYEASSSDHETREAMSKEFTNRLTVLDKRLQQTLQEKHVLLQELQTAKTETAGRLSRTQVDEMIREKDEQITDLMREGEKLSKQELQQMNIIKKLRCKEKEQINLIKQQREKLEEDSKELDRVRKALNAKEEIERKQIDVIRQLTNSVQKMELELATVKSDLEDSNEKANSMKVALEGSYKEVAELHRKTVVQESELQDKALSAERLAREELEANMAELKREHRHERDSLLIEIDQLRYTLTQSQLDSSRTEDQFKQEIDELSKRLTEHNDESINISSAVSGATRPLFRQIESLQSQLNNQTGSWEKLERNLTTRLNEVQSQLAISQEKDRCVSEKYAELAARSNAFETQIDSLRQDKIRLQSLVDAEKNTSLSLRESKIRESVEFESITKLQREETARLQKLKVMLEQQIVMEKTALEAEKRKTASLLDQLNEVKTKRNDELRKNTPSPTLSISSCMSESFDRSSLYDNVKYSGSNLVENLQAQIQLRQGKHNHLQNEIVRLERDRENMATELSRMSLANQELTNQLGGLELLKQKHSELETRYNAILQMYGEKAEQCEELRLDLAEMKDAYKTQIEELLRESSKSEL